MLPAEATETTLPTSRVYLSPHVGGSIVDPSHGNSDLFLLSSITCLSRFVPYQHRHIDKERHNARQNRSRFCFA